MKDIKGRFEGTCEYCGCPTYSQYRSTLKRFCSHKCSNNWKWENIRERQKYVIKKCAYCGKEIQLMETDERIKNGQSIFYCSHKCSGLARKLNKKCPICGNIIKDPHFRTCSKKCGIELRDMKYYSHLTVTQKQEKDRIKRRRALWQDKYYKENPLRKFRDAVRKNVSQSFKRKRKYSKNRHTEEILGCSIEFFREYIEGKFTEGMSLENYGEWQLDHIIPISTARTKDDIIKLCHYTNYQPLWKKDNLSKKDKII